VSKRWKAIFDCADLVLTGASKAVALETVDFNDPNHPKTCLAGVGQPLRQPPEEGRI